MSVIPDMDDFLETGLAWLEGVTPYDLATVWVVEGTQLKVRAARGRLRSQRVMRHAVDLGAHPDLRRVLEARLPRVNSEHDHTEGEGDLFDDVIDLAPGHSCMVVPLHAGTRTLGLLSLDRNVCESYTDDAMRLVDLYARILATGMLVTEQATALGELYRREQSRAEILAEAQRAVGKADPVGNLAKAREPRMRTLVEQARAAAGTNSAILILGETGTGKEVLAEAVHRWSGRHAAPFIKLNCAAIPAGTLESELFGHVKGAFTGAVKDRDGRFRAADGGTLFLDEIGELPLALQAKLLRVLQEGTLEPVGSDKTIKVDVRIVAATNANLEEAIKTKAFREDLYYRINVFPLRLPPLRERSLDFDAIVATLLARLAPQGAPAIDEEGWLQLKAYNWPGNIRELSNVLERALILARAAGALLLTPFLLATTPSSGAYPLSAKADAASAGTFPTLEEAEAQHIARALEQTSGKIYGPGGAALLLGLKPSTLQSKMKKLGVRRA